MWASDKGCTDIVEYLVDHGADVNVHDVSFLEFIAPNFTLFIDSVQIGQVSYCLAGEDTSALQRNFWIVAQMSTSVLM